MWIRILWGDAFAVQRKSQSRGIGNPSVPPALRIRFFAPVWSVFLIGPG